MTPRAGTLRAAALLVLGALWSGGCGHGLGAGCSSPGNSPGGANAPLTAEWSGGPLPTYTPLSVPELQTIMAQGVAQALAAGSSAVISVVDREGFVLGVFAMTGAPLGPVFPVPATLPSDAAAGINAAIAKARTAGFLSSSQNAFSSLTAAYISDTHFPPGVQYQPGGPLFGVVNSSLTASDVLTGIGPGGAPNSNNPTPLPNPNGLSGQPGGLPIYKGGFLVGAVGVSGTEPDQDERISIAAANGFMAPAAIRASETYIDGIELVFVQTAGPFVVVGPAFGSLPGSVVDPVSQGPGTLVAGGPPPAIPTATVGGVLGQMVYPVISSPLAGSPQLQASDVTTILTAASASTTTLRSEIRIPVGSVAQVTISVVDTAGNILGVFRPPDNTRFSLDVAVQKARTAVVYSASGPAAGLGLPVAGLPPGSAVTTRAVGWMSQPLYPPGIDGTSPGPLFGIQTSLPGGLGAGIPGLDVTPASTTDATNGNGITIFPGGIPLYIGGILVGAIGVSGDGVDQDDYVAAAGTAGYEPPSTIRCDNFSVAGAALPYVKFPRNPTGGQ